MMRVLVLELVCGLADLLSSVVDVVIEAEVVGAKCLSIYILMTDASIVIIIYTTLLRA